MMAAPSEVINWADAMQQVGDDEEFLKELLGDLRSELQTQLTTIQGIIEKPQDDPYHKIMRAAHVIKGAAANLMCGQLRHACMALEHAASAAHEAGSSPPPELVQAVETNYGNMQQAGNNFLGFLQSIGV